MRRGSVIVIVVLVISLIHNVHRLPAVISIQEVEVIEALNGTEKKNQSKSAPPSPLLVVDCILKPRDVAVMDYATFEAIAPTNIKTVIQNGG